MKRVFADTGYWIALLDPKDKLHSKAVNLSIDLSEAEIITSQMVLGEVLNHFSKSGEFLRYAVISLIESLQVNPSITIIVQTDDIFQQALTLYKQRPDQAWSHTDCTSFCIMKQQEILESLAYKKRFEHFEHFEEAGFVALLDS